MNVEHEFATIPNVIAMPNRIRAYDITFDIPGFRTLQYNNRSEANIARMKLIYTPRHLLVEFHSFHEYLLKYQDVSMALESAGWSIVDDFFEKMKPLYCKVVIDSELADGIWVTIAASRGWRNVTGDSPSPQQQSEQMFLGVA